MERIKQWHEQNNFKRMAMRVLALIMALNMLLVMLPVAEIGGIVNAAEGEAKVFTPADTFGTDYGYKDIAVRSNGAKRQDLYSRIEAAADAFAASTDDFADDVICEIDISDLGLSYDEITETYFTLKHDNPQYYWLSSTLSLVGMDLQLMTSEDYRKYSDRKACDEIIAEKLAEYDAIVENLTSNYEVALAIHDKMIADIEYSYEADGVTPSTAISAHNIIGVFDDDIALAVCEGYTSAYQMLLNRYGINNVYVTGESYGDNHAWNMVQMDDGKYYLTDVTWDDTRVSADENGVDMPSYAFFNMASSDFNKEHTANTTEGTSIYFLYELPEAADAYDYTFYKMNAGILGQNTVAKLGDDNNGDLVVAITESIKNAFSNGSDIVYLYGIGYTTGYMVNRDIDTVIEGASLAAHCAEETAFYSCDFIYMQNSSECIMKVNVDPSIRQKNIALYHNGALVDTYATLDGAFEQMTDKNGDYEIKLDGDKQSYYYLSPIYESLPEANSVAIRYDVPDSNYYMLATIRINSGFTISGNVELDCVMISWEYEENLYLRNAKLTMNNGARFGIDTYTENSTIIVTNGTTEIYGNLYGYCDVELRNGDLMTRGNAEIDELIIDIANGYTGRLWVFNYSGVETYNICRINKIISGVENPINVDGNSNEVIIKTIESAYSDWHISVELNDDETFPKIAVEEMKGINSVEFNFSLSSTYSMTDSSGNVVGGGTETCDKAIFENSDDFFICSDAENVGFSASYYSNVEGGKLEVINKNGSIGVRGNDELIEYCYITYYFNDGTDSHGEKTKNVGVDLSLEWPWTREGYSFIEWNTAKDGSGTSYAYDAIYSEDKPLTLYAQWEKCENHFYESKVDGTCNNCGIHREKTEKRTVMHMFRMYDPNSGEHFYTGSEVERDNLVAAGWDYEGVGFTFSMKTGAPVYRLYEPITGEHLYTMDEKEKADLMSAGWNLEGVAFNSAYDTEVPQYRLHNPNATRGAYHFTASEEERDFLIAAGWEDQGIGFYSAWK